MVVYGGIGPNNDKKTGWQICILGKKNMEDIQMATKHFKKNIEMYPSQLEWSGAN